MIIIRYKDVKDGSNDIIEMFDTVAEFKNYIDVVLANIEVDLDISLFNGRPYKDVFRNTNFYDKLDTYFQYNCDVRIEVI